jgi:hypothetical protein
MVLNNEFIVTEIRSTGIGFWISYVQADFQDNFHAKTFSHTRVVVQEREGKRTYATYWDAKKDTTPQLFESISDIFSNLSFIESWSKTPQQLTHYLKRGPGIVVVFSVST